MRKERGQPFLNGQLDLWSSGLAKDAFGGFTASLLLEEDFEEEVDTATLSESELKDYVRQEIKPRISVMKLIMKSILLDFSSFPFKVVYFSVVLNSSSHGHNNAVSIALPTTTKSHTAVNIESWLKSCMAKYGLQLADFHLMVRSFP